MRLCRRDRASSPKDYWQSADRRVIQIGPNDERQLVGWIITDFRVEAGHLAAVKINRVRSPAKLADPVPVLLALRLARYLGLQAVEPLALIVGVEDLTADQRRDPCGAIVGGRDDTSGRRGVGRVLLGAVIGLEGSGFDRGLDVGRVRLVRQITKGAAAVQVAMRVRLWECVRRDGGEHCVLQTQRSEQSVLE